MVYYIRFLKPPKLQHGKNGLATASALISITTDLGDAFLAEDVSLQAQLIAGDTNTVLQKKDLLWQAGKRELPVSIGPIRFGLKNQPIGLAIGIKDASSSVFHDELNDSTTLPLVMSGWSASFGGSESATAAKLVERRFNLEEHGQLRIWEETGNNIARHIWDAALAAVICLQSAITNSPSSELQKLQSRFQHGTNKTLRVVELGAGCGIVGIALAQMQPRSAVILTDLPEVNDIVSRNMRLAHLAAGSSVEFQVLDWDEPHGDVFADGLDLILVSDCTYNADSLPALVLVLSHATRRSPDALVLVSLKRRHDSEAVFFELMQAASFRIVEQTAVSLPAAYSEADRIEIYGFQHVHTHT
ncbi:putative methyltransferase-domain-containing protein [Talaromyces proteolyticus]|uniref:Methyltransferase-domain-containing protein n=1 Tax=Talaromyces proteolyticus TaxID=1131652 RepID=A0AAD4PXI7_9EURO|nr:putative methyltransferase-domain-containing protein [Talaromyces proteolyticus]KAH8693715.1 putative methyltransferase-domain-containing protein [Talaromyces proteolyticus]